MKIVLLSLAILSAPLSAFAMCGGYDQQAMSCAEGTVYDPQTQSCVPQTS